MSPPGREREGGPAVSLIGNRLRTTTSTPPSAEVAPSTVAPGADGGGDLDADLSITRDAVDNIGVWMFIWSARREPDAFARRCASDAIGAADNLLAAAHRIRARLITEVRVSDELSAGRADSLLARLRQERGEDR